MDYESEIKIYYFFFFYFAAKNLSRVIPGESQRKFGTVTTTLKGSMGERINKALAKVEEKKRKRAIRRAEVGGSGCGERGILARRYAAWRGHSLLLLFRLSVSGRCCFDRTSIHHLIFCCSSQSTDACFFRKFLKKKTCMNLLRHIISQFRVAG